ncbi:MAG: multicopper oxidase domain-containing protein [Actinomycetaceae bacterium]|nr:multicopper oxidase domain-containing protein [Actinomycetaceae bacterium]
MRSRWHQVTGGIVLAYLLLDALIIVSHHFLPDARWLMVHTFTLGAITNALFVWTEHFATAILRFRPDPNRRGQIGLLALLNAGIAVTVTGMLSGIAPILLLGVVLVGGAVAGHGIRLGKGLQKALPARFTIIVQAYVAAAVMLLPGIVFGYLMATGLAPQWHIAALGAHVAFNVLGWVALPIVATLLTLWPTMLRAPLPPSAEATARRFLPFLMTMPAMAALGAVLFGISANASRIVLTAAIAGFTALTVIILVPLARTTWELGKGSFPAMSVAAGAAWLLATIGATGVRVAFQGTADALTNLGDFLVPLLGGGIAQVLLGSLSYLLPVMVGGGPRPLRVRIARVDTWATWRIGLINLSLPIYLLASGSLITVVTSMAAFVGGVLSVVMIIRALLPVSDKEKEDAPPPLTDESTNVNALRRYRRGSLAAVTTVALLVGGAVVADPVGAGLPLRTVTAGSGTGEVTRVTVSIEGMRFLPELVEVPSGNALEITITNDGDQSHDLVLENGARTPRLAPGESTVLDAGVISADVEGWCSIAGHRQMGMVFHIRVTGSTGGGSSHMAERHGSKSHAHSSAASFDLAQPMDPARHFEAELPPLAPAEGPVTHEVTMRVSESEMEAAPGLTQRLWTFNDTVPGPVLHGRVGDTFVVTLVNDGTMGHSIDFHAGALAPDEPMRTIDPGEQLTYTFTAERAGIWMYHCSTAPMSLHIANGMYGAVVIEPEDLPEVDRSFVLIQGESYYGTKGEIADAQKIVAGVHDTTHFNGYPNQYVQYPLEVATGERVRMWVLNAGPNLPLSFHVVGGQFDTVFKEGAYTLRADNSEFGGSQALGLLPAEGGFVELVFPEAGHYVAVNHIMSEAERGAKAIIEVHD